MSEALSEYFQNIGVLFIKKLMTKIVIKIMAIVSREMNYVPDKPD